MKHRGHIHLETKEPLNVPLTLQSGQTFRWKSRNGFWEGIIHRTEIHLTQMGDTIEYETFGDFLDDSVLLDYLGLNHSIAEIYRNLSREKEIKSLLRKYRGLRILKQDPWETMASFILSSCTNIPRIIRMIDGLSRQLGSSFTGAGNRIVHQFPTPIQIASSNVKVLRKIGLGYRSEYLHATATKIVNEDMEFSRLENKPYSTILEVLENYPGIGKKIADCIALFGLRKLEAFPIDTHIFTSLVEKYSDVLGVSKETNLSPRVYDHLRSACQERFGVYAGYVQQYLYVHTRESKNPSNKLVAKFRC
ncbi:MAG: DNA glycosylase [Candidatus Ranarchaeia archaeon]